MRTEPSPHHETRSMNTGCHLSTVSDGYNAGHDIPWRFRMHPSHGVSETIPPAHGHIVTSNSKFRRLDWCVPFPCQLSYRQSISVWRFDSHDEKNIRPSARNQDPVPLVHRAIVPGFCVQMSTELTSTMERRMSSSQFSQLHTWRCLLSSTLSEHSWSINVDTTTQWFRRPKTYLTHRTKTKNKKQNLAEITEPTQAYSYSWVNAKSLFWLELWSTCDVCDVFHNGALEWLPLPCNDCQYHNASNIS